MSIPLRGAVAAATFVLALGAGTGHARAAGTVPAGNAPDSNVPVGTVSDSNVPAGAVPADNVPAGNGNNTGDGAVGAGLQATPEDQPDAQSSKRGLDSVTQRADILKGMQETAREQRKALVTTWQRKAAKAVSFAYRQKGRPYVWGGTGRRGYDCSGLVQRSWRQAGVSIPRVAADQYRRIRKHVGARELRPGDLVYFDHLGHVGLYVGGGHFIHAPHTGSRVQVTALNSYWRAHLVGAARPGWPHLPVVPTRLV
jgi:cell wall-associated NlpC family hydrolase